MSEDSIHKCDVNRSYQMQFGFRCSPNAHSVYKYTLSEVSISAQRLLMKYAFYIIRINVLIETNEDVHITCLRNNRHNMP